VGEALRILAAEITLADKNVDRYRGQTLQLYSPAGDPDWYCRMMLGQALTDVGAGDG
jgi:hypothetical protein